MEEGLNDFSIPFDGTRIIMGTFPPKLSRRLNILIDPLIMLQAIEEASLLIVFQTPLASIDRYKIYHFKNTKFVISTKFVPPNKCPLSLVVLKKIFQIQSIFCITQK